MAILWQLERQYIKMSGLFLNLDFLCINFAHYSKNSDAQEENL